MEKLITIDIADLQVSDDPDDLGCNCKFLKYAKKHYEVALQNLIKIEKYNKFFAEKIMEIKQKLRGVERTLEILAKPISDQSKGEYVK